MTARSFLGAGDIYIDRLVGGVSTGMVGPIYANSLELQPSVNTVESTSKGRYDYGQVLESVNIAQPTTLKMELKEVTGDILVMAFLGTSSALNETAGTMTDLAFTAKLGKWVELGKRNLAALQAVENTGGTITYVEGTHYKLNRPMGWIMALPGGTITEDQPLTISGTYAAATGVVVKGSTQTEVRARIIFDGINQADGTQVKVSIWEAVLSADSAFDFLADDFGNVSLTGNVKTPVGKDAPYIVEVQNPLA